MAFGTCTWEYNSGTWTIKTCGCDPGHVCAPGLTPAQSLPGGGTTVKDDEFRRRLNAAHLAKHGNSIDVIPKALRLANTATYEMDCE
jgi:hypothetical protein